MLSPKEKAVLETIAEDKVYENYFFSKVTDIKWFDVLNDKGYFSPEKAPVPQPSDQEGYYMIPHWNVLDYLERVSQQIGQGKNETYAEKLLDIINKVTKYRDNSKALIDNYRLWWYFVKVLLNIPNDKIAEYLESNRIKLGED